MDDSFWIRVGDAELAALTIGGALFLILYTLLARWWRWREGWFIFVAGTGLTALFAYIYAIRAGWLPPLVDGGPSVWIRLLIFTGFGVALVWIGVLLLMAQYEQWKAKHRNRSER